MSESLLFDFTVDKATATIYITREFAAGLDLVWDAYTIADILDKWMGPKPMRVQTKEMDFREGGRWLYAMMSADNVPLGWSLAEFLEIRPKTSFTTRNSFADENGNPASTGFTFSITRYTFTEEAGITTVKISKKMESLAQLEKFVTLGFKEGTIMGMRNLDEYLLTLTSGK